MSINLVQGKNCIIGKNVSFGNDVTLGHNCIIEDNVVIGNHSYIDSNTIIRSHVVLGENAFIGANSILGEYVSDFFVERINQMAEKIRCCSTRYRKISSSGVVSVASKVGTCDRSSQNGRLSESH